LLAACERYTVQTIWASLSGLTTREQADFIALLVNGHTLSSDGLTLRVGVTGASTGLSTSLRAEAVYGFFICTQAEETFFATFGIYGCATELAKFVGASGLRWEADLLAASGLSALVVFKWTIGIGIAISGKAYTASTTAGEC
jgi:hypothetical protein